MSLESINEHTSMKEHTNKNEQLNQHNYDDIIDLPHPISKRHPQMSPLNRAAQFLPFAALTGHDAAIRETARLTDTFIELDESRKEQLNEQLQLLREKLSQRPEIEATYFQPDEKKSGGTYITIRGRLKKIDEYRHRLLFTDGTSFPLENLFSLRGDLFSSDLFDI